jgi:hypothetical protein
MRALHTLSIGVRRGVSCRFPFPVLRRRSTEHAAGRSPPARAAIEAKSLFRRREVIWSASEYSLSREK